MQLEHLTLALRPRSAWEAMELGAALLRRHAGVTWRAWGLTSLATWIPLAGLLWWLGALPWLLLLMWWLKPVFDRIVLHVLSRAAFGQVPSALQAALASVRFGRERLLGDLTWRRIGLGRALDLPVGILEGVHGARLRGRRRVISTHGGSAVSVLTLLCLHFEAAIVLGLYLLLPLLLPQEYLRVLAQDAYALLNQPLPDWAWLLTSAVAWIGISVIEPFYIAAGFGVYLNSRVHLEAWDIELAFRRLAQRLRQAARIPVLLLALGTAAGVQVSSAHAAAAPAQTDAPASLQAVYPHPIHDARFRQAHADAYRDPLLRPTRTQTEWQRRTPANPAERRRWLDPEALGPLLRAMLVALEVLAWAAVIGLAAWLLWMTRHWWSRWERADRPHPRADSAPVVETPAPEADLLPEAIVASARRLWARGAPRAAMSLLYRASVQALGRRLQADLPPGSTEARCLRAARALPDPEDRDLFSQVVRAWQQAAYAHAPPAEEAFHGLLQRAAERFGWRS